MSEKAPLSREMLNTLRTMALNTLPAGHGAWRLFGYIDWLETQLEDPDAYAGDWRARFGHPDAE